MLKQLAEGVLIHESEPPYNNAVVVQGRTGVLLIDPGVTGDEIDCLANDLSNSGQTVVAGFSTHPHWDHLLWHASGAAPRYGTARCAAAVRDWLSDAHAKARLAALIPLDIAEQVPLELLGLISGLPAGTALTRSRTTSPRCGCSRAQQTTSTSSSPAMGPSAELIRYTHGSTLIRVRARVA